MTFTADMFKADNGPVGQPCMDGAPTGPNVAATAWPPDPQSYQNNPIRGGARVGIPTSPARLRGNTSTAPGEPIGEVVVPSLVKAVARDSIDQQPADRDARTSLSAPTGLGNRPPQVISRIQHALAEHMAEANVQAMPLRESASPQFQALGMTPVGQHHLGTGAVEPGRPSL